MTDTFKFTFNYTSGNITKFEAGVIYRAMKEKTIKVRAATTSWLYDQAKKVESPEYAMRRYNQNSIQYTRLYLAVQFILDGDYESAQEQLTWWEEHMIETATKKSTFYRYQKELA